MALVSAFLTDGGASKLTSPWSSRKGLSTEYIMSRMRMMPEKGTVSRYCAIQEMILVLGTMPHPKHAATDHDVLDLIRERWSPRAYDASRAIPQSELWRLFEAARWT